MHTGAESRHGYGTIHRTQDLEPPTLFTIHALHVDFFFFQVNREEPILWELIEQVSVGLARKVGGLDMAMEDLLQKEDPVRFLLHEEETKDCRQEVL